MQKELPFLDLPFVKSADKLEVQSPFSKFSSYSIPIHLLVIHSEIPNGESCTRRGAEDPVGVEVIDKFDRGLAV